MVTADDAWVVDYKTHDTRDPDQLEKLCAHYRPQLAHYREAVRRLWPEHRIRTCLLFTASGRLSEIAP